MPDGCMGRWWIVLVRLEVAIGIKTASRQEPASPAPAAADTTRLYSATFRVTSVLTPPATAARLRHSLTGRLQRIPVSSRSRTVGVIPRSSDREAELLFSSNDDTPERNLPLYRDALRKVPRLVYVRNLDGGEDICPDLGKINCSSGEGCCKGKYRWLKHPTGTCLYDAFSSQLVKLAIGELATIYANLHSATVSRGWVNGPLCILDRAESKMPAMHSIRRTQASITAMFR